MSSSCTVFCLRISVPLKQYYKLPTIHFRMYLAYNSYNTTNSSKICTLIRFNCLFLGFWVN